MFQDPNLYHMNNATRNLPQYMKRNLKKMPNNKGYIYKGVYFYGAKSPNKRDSSNLMFEQVDKNTLRIIKTTEKNIIISEKNQRTNKTTIIYEEKRIPIYCAPFTTEQKKLMRYL